MDEYRFDLSGGALCLDFVNTVGDRPRGEEEHLGSYADLASWAAQSRVVDEGTLRRLRRVAATHPARAERLFAKALELRESLYRTFSAIAGGAVPPRDDVALLNTWLPRALRMLRIGRSERQPGFEWRWASPRDALDQILWPVVQSAADLLTSAEQAQVRECAGDPCSWLFVDRSRTGRRRWCSMNTCGNRSKVRRFHERHREACAASSRAS